MPSVWPFVPNSGATETFEYYTEVLKSYTKEQRIRLREDPRYLLSYDFLLDDEQYANAKVIAKAENQTGSFKVPVWQDAYKHPGTILSTATTISIDTTLTRFVGSEVIIWSDWDSYTVCSILSKTATSITLTAAVGTAYTEAFVIPLLTMRALGGFQTSTGAPNVNTMGVKFTSIDYDNYIRLRTDIFVDPDFMAWYDIFMHYYGYYKGEVAIVNPPYRLSAQSGSIVRPIQMVDNGFGPIAVEATFEIAEERFNLDFFYQGKEQRRENLGLLCQFNGKQRPFWLPTFTKDIVLQAGTFSTNSLTVAAIGPLSNYTGKSIYIRHKDGTYQWATITTAVLSSGNYVLTLDANLSQPVSNALVDYISFMRLSRFDTDNFEFTSGSATSGKVTLNSIEVPN